MVLDKRLKEGLKNYRNELAAKHALLESIEACIDISNHIISAKGFRRSVDYKDVFEVLKEEKIISKKLAERLKEMAKFRNVLVHKYAIVDKKRLLRIMKEDIRDIEEFIKEIMRKINE